MDTNTVLSIISIFVSLSGWIVFLYDRATNLPRIKGSIIETISSTWVNESFQKPVTCILVYLFIVNIRKNPVKVVDYDLEIDIGKGYERFIRVFGEINNPVFNSNEYVIDIPDLNSKLIHTNTGILDYGIPVHGFLPFISKTMNLEEIIKMKKLKITCIDAFGKKHYIKSKPKRFRGIAYLQEISGMRIQAK
jgi:hypothetical protein